MVDTIVDALEAIRDYLQEQDDITEKVVTSWEWTNEVPAIVVAPVGMTYEHDDIDLGRRVLPPWRAAEFELFMRTAAGAIGGEKDALDMAERVESALIADPLCNDRFQTVAERDNAGDRKRGAGVLLTRLTIRDQDELTLDENEEAPEVSLRVAARFGVPR